VKKSFNIQERLHPKSKHCGTKPMHPSSSRAFHRHQHDLKHPGLVDLISTKQNKPPSFIDRCSLSVIIQFPNSFCVTLQVPFLYGYKGSYTRSMQKEWLGSAKSRATQLKEFFKLHKMAEFSCYCQFWYLTVSCYIMTDLCSSLRPTYGPFILQKLKVHSRLPSCQLFKEFLSLY
jgi:hypothetical protein